jgi:hypothetical protein
MASKPLSPASPLILVLALLPAGPAVAFPSVRLLDDAPRRAVLPSVLGAPDAPSSITVAPTSAGLDFGTHFGITLVPSIFASTAGVVLAWALGGLSNTLLGAIIPALLAHLLVGPGLTALVALLVGNDKESRFGFWGPAAGAFLIHAATFLVASLLLVVPWTNPVALLAYTAIDGVLMAGASVGLMHLFPKKVAAAELRSFVPGVSETRVLPMATLHF